MTTCSFTQKKFCQQEGYSCDECSRDDQQRALHELVDRAVKSGVNPDDIKRAIQMELESETTTSINTWLRNLNAINVHHHNINDIDDAYENDVSNASLAIEHPGTVAINPATGNMISGNQPFPEGYVPFQIPTPDTFNIIESIAKSRRIELTEARLVYLESGMNNWECDDEKSYEFDYLHNLDPSYARGEWEIPSVITYCGKEFQIIDTPYLEDSTYFCAVAECDGLQYYVEWEVMEIVKETEKSITFRIFSNFSSCPQHWKSNGGITKTFRKTSRVYVSGDQDQSVY
jgi:hypothetical protein